MPSIIQAGNAASTGLVTTGATDGILELRSGTAAGGTVAMTINAGGVTSTPLGANFATSSGNVGIGTSSPATKLEVYASSDSLQIESVVRNSQSGTGVAAIGFNVSSNAIGEVSASKAGIGLQRGNLQGVGALCFYNSASTGTADFTTSDERMRIDSSGNLLVGKTTDSETTNGVNIRSDGVVYAVSSSDAGVFYRKTANTGFGVILTKSDVGGTNALVGAGFANGTFAAVSDINKKKNIEDARGYLSDLVQIRVVKYNWKTDEEGTPKELGWIAQEVGQIFPGMVSEMDGSVLLKKEVFVPMLVKAIQEQQAIITSLTARIEALETAP